MQQWVPKEVAVVVTPRPLRVMAQVLQRAVAQLKAVQKDTVRPGQLPSRGQWLVGSVFDVIDCLPGGPLQLLAVFLSAADDSTFGQHLGLL